MIFFPADRLLPWNILRHLQSADWMIERWNGAETLAARFEILSLLRKISASSSCWHCDRWNSGETSCSLCIFQMHVQFATCPQKSDSWSEVVNGLCAWCIQTYNDSRVKLFSINWQPFTHARHLSSENCKQSLSCVDNLYLIILQEFKIHFWTLSYVLYYFLLFCCYTVSCKILFLLNAHL